MIYSISKDFAISTDSCDMPSLRCKKFFDELLNLTYFHDLDGIRDETFQAGDGPPSPIHFLSHCRGGDHGNLEEKEKYK